MNESFDPYYKWLGIPPDEQPPHHYRLLGLRAMEPDPEVIMAAADRQMAHLRTYQTGKHADFSQQLLNEVAIAKVCLLNPKRKSQYDEDLRQKIEAAAAAARPASPAVVPPPPPPPRPVPPPVHAPPVAAVVPPPPPVATSAVVAPPVQHEAAVDVNEDSTVAVEATPLADAPPVRPTAKPKKSERTKPASPGPVAIRTDGPKSRRPLVKGKQSSAIWLWGTTAVVGLVSLVVLFIVASLPPQSQSQAAADSTAATTRDVDERLRKTGFGALPEWKPEPNPVFDADETAAPQVPAHLVGRFWQSTARVDDVFYSGAQPHLDVFATARGEAAVTSPGVLKLSGGSLVAVAVSDLLYRACRETNELTLAAWITPESLDQDGPARIISYSFDSEERDFTLGQSKDKLILRLRTPSTGPNGLAPQVDLAKLSGKRQFVVVTYFPGELVCYLDGARVLKSDRIQGDFSNWVEQRLVFGNEYRSARPWRGELSHVSIFCKAVSPAEAAKLYELSKK